jgi:hypothetical protein
MRCRDAGENCITGSYAIRRIRWAGYVARIGMKKKMTADTLWVEKPEGRRPLGRPRRIYEDNIKIDLGEIGGGGWIGLVWLKRGTSGELL